LSSLICIDLKKGKDFWLNAVKLEFYLTAAKFSEGFLPAANDLDFQWFCTTFSSIKELLVFFSWCP